MRRSGGSQNSSVSERNGELLEDRVGCYDVSVFPVDVEVICSVRSRCSIADGIPGDDRSVAVLQAVDGRGSDATAGDRQSVARSLRVSFPAKAVGFRTGPL